MDMLGTLFESIEDRNLARLREVLAGRHREWPITPRQIEILRRLENRRGLARIMGRKELCDALRCDRRELSQDVQELRRLGIGIGSSRDAENGGYYLIVTEAELIATKTPYLHQALTMLRIAQALDPAGFHGSFGQLKLQLFPDDAKTLEQGFLEAANG
jgi:biotin operon repressor